MYAYILANHSAIQNDITSWHDITSGHVSEQTSHLPACFSCCQLIVCWRSESRYSVLGLGRLY